jgi:death-on-curing protein
MRQYLQEHDEIPAERGIESGKVLRRVRRFDVDEIATWLETGEIDEDRLDP